MISREKLYLDCLGAAGAATLQGNFVRVFINNEPFGLFLMIDDSTDNFINNAMRAGNQKFQYTGPTYKGNALNPQLEGNLVYKDDLETSYNDTIYELEDSGNQKKALVKGAEKGPLINFIRELNMIDPTTVVDEASKGSIEKLLDPTHTMIHLALSFMTGSWDGVWHQASNYYLTQETSSGQWALISYDFDETFGTGAPRYMSTTPYSNFSRPDSQRPLVDAFIKSPYYQAQFEDIIKTLVKKFFKPSVITPRLEAWADMLRAEVEWDLSIPPKSPGMTTQWTLWNFDNNLMKTDGESMGVAEWVEARSAALQTQLAFTDVDDLPPLATYESQGTWDANNYEKEPAKENKDDKTSAASKQTVFSAITLLAVGASVGQYLL